MLGKASCEALERCMREAFSAAAEARRIRRVKDVSFHEDARLSREEYLRMHGVIRHLLVGHEGRPCPAGERPIVSAIEPWERAVWRRREKLMKAASEFTRRRGSA